MMDLQERLSEHMDSQMSATRQSNLGDVMERGEAFRRQRRLVSATLPAAAVLVVVVGVMFYDRGGPGDRGVAEADVAAASAAQLSVSQGAFEWEVGPATLGFTQETLESGGVLYALSTAPGARFEDFPQGDIPKAVYTSTDGREWTSQALGGSWASSIAARDGLLYAVGTAPGAEAGATALRIDISGDRGENFEGVTLPIHDGSGQARIGANVMATPGGVLAIATSRTSTDPMSLLPPGVLEGAVEPIMVENPEGGIAVFPAETAEVAYEECFSDQPERCAELVEEDAIEFFTWEDLGVEGEKMVFGESTTHTAYWSADGRDFAEVDYPLPEGFLQDSFTVGDHAVAVVGGPGGTRLFASDDARSWQPLNTPPVGMVHAIGETGDRVVIVASKNDTRTAIFHGDDLFGQWEEIPLEDLIGQPDGQESRVWTSSATVSDAGVALSVSVQQEARGGNPLETLMDRFTGDDPAAAAGGDREPRRLEEEELEARAEEEELEARAVEIHSVILHSTDLADWTAVPSTDFGVNIDSLLTAPDGRLIAHAVAIGDGGDPVRQQYVAQP